MKVYENLAAEDLKLLLDAPILVTILIGGADGNLDEDEKTWGDKLAHIRKDSNSHFLSDYYEDASVNFSERLEKILADLPENTEPMLEAVSDELAKLNKVYEKLDINFVTALNKSLRSFAHQIAEASGGILGFGAESFQEHQWVDLSMIKK